MAEDRVLLARGASWSDKEVFFLLLLLLSEVGVGGASGMEFEVAQCMKNFLLVFCLQGVVVMLNLVLLVSVKYTSTTVDSGVAIGVRFG